MLEEIQRIINDLKDEAVEVGTVVSLAVKKIASTTICEEIRGLQSYYKTLLRNHLNFFSLRYCEKSQMIMRLVNQVGEAVTTPSELPVYPKYPD